MATKVDGKKDNSLAQQGKLRNSASRKRVSIVTKVKGKNDNSLAKQGKVRNSSMRKQVPTITKVHRKKDDSLAQQEEVPKSNSSKQVSMITKVNGENGASIVKQEDLDRERDRLHKAHELAPDDVNAYKALCAFDRRHPARARELFGFAELTRFTLIRHLFPTRWELLWSSFRAEALEHQKSLAGVDPSPKMAAVAEQAATDYLCLSALQIVNGAQGLNFGYIRVTSNLVDGAQRRYLRTLKLLAVVGRIEKGVEMHVTHHHTIAAESQPQGRRVRRLPDDEIVEGEAVDVRQPDPVPLLPK